MNRRPIPGVLLAVGLAALLTGCWGDKSTSLEIGGGGGVAGTATPVGIDKCHNCHSLTAEDNVGIFDAWLASKHGNPDPASHASYANFAADTTCNGASCHDPQGDGYNLSKFVGAGFYPRPVVACEACHGGGSEHFGVGPMAYPTPAPTRCAQCHFKNSPPEGHRTYHPNAWGGKGDPGIYEAYASSNHTRSVNTHVYDSAAPTKVLAKCSKCHTDEGGRLYKAISNVSVLDCTATYPSLTVFSAVQCRTCHKAHGVPELLKDASTGQSAQYNTCTDCHQDSNAYHDPATNTYGNLAEIITDTHFENAAKTTAAIIQGYIIRKGKETSCTDCHNPHSADLTENRQWKASGHGDFESTAWWEEGVLYTGSSDAYSRCQRCHTSTGYVRYTDNQANTLDNTMFLADGYINTTTKEAQMLYCWACHKVASTGFTVARRTVEDARIPGAWDNGTVFYSSTTNLNSYTKISNKGDSELCMNCHSSRPGRNGFFVRPYLTLAGTNIDNVAFGGPTPHYLVAVQTLFQDNTKGIGAYALPGRNYANNIGFAHNTIGGSTSGPCVGCHMSSPNSTTDETIGKHSFLPVTRLTDGTITAITSTKCAECHGVTTAAISVSSLNATKTLDNTRVAEFKIRLEANNIFPNAAGSQFYSDAAGASAGTSSKQIKNWATRAAAIPPAGGFAQLDGYDLWGIAYNYAYLRGETREPGHYAHNSVYVNRLIFDAITALNGTPSFTRP